MIEGYQVVEHGLAYPSILVVVALLLPFRVPNFCYYLLLFLLQPSNYFVLVNTQNALSCFVLYFAIVSSFQYFLFLICFEPFFPELRVYNMVYW